jgi:hypothetical protein
MTPSNDRRLDTPLERTLKATQSLIVITSILVGGIAWGVRLEMNQSIQGRDLTDMKVIVDKGMLPITAISIISLKETLAKVISDLELIKLEQQKMNIEITRLKPLWYKGQQHNLFNMTYKGITEC